jgi:hypothetical protein
MKRVIGPSLCTVNEVFPEKSFFCHAIENKGLFVISTSPADILPAILAAIPGFFSGLRSRVRRQD